MGHELLQFLEPVVLQFIDPAQHDFIPDSSMMHALRCIYVPQGPLHELPPLISFVKHRRYQLNDKQISVKVYSQYSRT